MGCNCINCRTPGFRFHPTDEELINQLRNKLLGVETPGRKIALIEELGKMEPQELPELTTDSWDDDQICYFFWSPVYKKNGISRTAKNGYWKATGKVRKVKAKTTKHVIGEKKTLVFYKGSCQGKVSPWVIHEYHLLEPALRREKEKKNYVLCKLKLKDNGKAEIFSTKEVEPTRRLPTVLNGNDGEHRSVQHSPLNFVTCNSNRDEALSICLSSNGKNDCLSNEEEEEVHNFPSDCQISVVADSAPKANQEYESRNDVPSNLGSPMTGDALPDGPAHDVELSAEPVSAEDCAENFGHALPVQPLMLGDASPTCEEASFSYTFSSDETDENGWRSYLADSNEAYIGYGNDQQNIVAEDQGFSFNCPDVVPPSPQSSFRKRLREEGSGFGDGEPESSRAKVELQGETNVGTTIDEECEQDLKWALRSFNQRHVLTLEDLTPHNGGGHEQMQIEEEWISVEDLFPSDDFGLRREFSEDPAAADQAGQA